jgi:O-antigen ligase
MKFCSQKQFSVIWAKTNFIPAAFFLLLFVALFFGDGKQVAVDTFFAGGIISLWIIAFYQKQERRLLPRAARLLWVAVFAAYAVSTVFSDSMGYSISSVARLCMGFLVYSLFYSLSSPKILRAFAIGTVVFVGLAALAATAYTLSPSLAGGLPSMNLLYANYGHNQLAGLLLFGIPIVILGVVPAPPWCQKALFVLFLLSMVFSFARGALILLMAFFLFLFVTKRLVGKFNIALVIMFTGAAVGLLIATFLLAPLFVHAPPTMISDWLYKQTIKPPIYESRIRYWLQAVSAIRERPAFGSGPGTFYLQSKRLQPAPSSYSWFAHSFPLEALVELGVLGALPLFLLLFYHGKEVVRGFRFGSGTVDAQYGAPLALAAGLTLIYSVYEYNMNYLIVWLLFWAASGLLFGASVKPDLKRAGSRPWIIYICLFAIGAYYVSSVASNLFSKRATTAFLIAPYDTTQALSFLAEKEKDGNGLTNQETVLLRVFHKNNPEVMYGLARISPTNIAFSIYDRALMYDPQNIQYVSSFIEYLLEEKNTAAIGTLIEKLGESVLPEASRAKARQIPFTSPAIGILYTPSLFKDAGYAGSRSEYLAKTYYFLGLAALEKDARLTEKLWTLARDSSPEWGYFHVELARLEFLYFNDYGRAQDALNYCQKFLSARVQCKQTVLRDLSVTDTEYEQIKAIPYLR